MKTIKEALLEQKDNAIGQKANFLIQIKIYSNGKPEDKVKLKKDDGTTQEIKRQYILDFFEQQIVGIDTLLKTIDEVIKDQ